jgi:cytochrome b6-f complex iron-sulfur subunit
MNASPSTSTVHPNTSGLPGDALTRRRQLLRRGFWAALGVLAVGAAATAADFLNPRDARRAGSPFLVPASNVPKAGADPFHATDGHFWLVNLKRGEGMPELEGSFVPPSGLGEASRGGGLLALSDRCPRQGCTVPWRPDFEWSGFIGWFRCPCCGSTFTKAGLRVFGPAARSLDTFPIVAVSQHGVRVRTARALLGGTDDAQRTVPAGPFG